MSKVNVAFLVMLMMAISGVIYAQKATEETFVLVETTDGGELISVNNLVGFWYNNGAKTTFNAIHGGNEQRYVELLQGSFINIKDDWAKDFAANSRIARWFVEGQKLFVFMPELGLGKVEIERQGKSLNYVMRFNNVEYNRKINLTGVITLTD